LAFVLNSDAEYHGSFSGILSTAIIGGAVVPVLIGRIGDYVELRSGMAFLYVTFRVVFSIEFWARPLINNATVHLRKAAAQTVVRRVCNPRMN
jgi:fucose permease